MRYRASDGGEFDFVGWGGGDVITLDGGLNVDLLKMQQLFHDQGCFVSM